MPVKGYVYLLSCIITMAILSRDCDSQNSYGKSFYLASMPLYSTYIEPVILKIVSDVSGFIQVVAPGQGINMTYTLTPKITEISLSYSHIRVTDAVGIDNKGIQLISTVEVAVFVAERTNTQGHSKFISLMPSMSDAHAFVVQSYKTDWDIRKSHFLVVATEDLTDVNITLKIAAGGNLTYSNTVYENGDTIRMSLNWLQTYYVYLYSNDLSGSVIESRNQS